MSKFKIHYACRSDVGNKRFLNEDSFIDRPDLGLWVVADGMGGCEGGEIASRIAVSHIPVQVEQGFSLQEAIYSAHEELLDAASLGLGNKGMGTTVVALKVDDDHYQVAWVGDSRAYLWQDKQLIQLTHDHSVVQDLVDCGQITKEEAIDHPDRNIITQALGSSPLQRLNVDSVSGRLNKRQLILLCSDGLTSEVQDAEINKLLDSPVSEEEKIDVLVEAALEQGGNDNITVIIVSLVRNNPLLIAWCHIKKLKTLFR